MTPLDGTQSSGPTVVVSRTVKEGREVEAERWLRRLARSAAASKGHLGADLQEPNRQHPGQWVIVYRFETSTLLEAWLHSEKRLSVLRDGEGFFEGEAQEQILAVAQAHRSVTAVSSFRLNAGSEAAFRILTSRLDALLGNFEGFLRCEVFEPVARVQEETAIIFSFTTRENLEQWLNSDDRRDWLASVEPHLTKARVTNVVGGFAGWFASPESAAVKRWKQAALVLVALYPTALVLGVALDALWPNAPFAIGVLLGNIVGVAVLSWILMPLLTNLFATWLRR